MRNVYNVGKIDYLNNGRKENLVTIEWELKDGRFSMSGSVWNRLKTDIYTGGQILEEILKAFPFNKKVQRMVEIWREYHLNDMQAGCEHQRQEKWKDRRIPVSEIPKSTANRDDKGILAIWVYPKEHKDGLLAVPCKVCGYCYGTKWLRLEIPANVIEEIESWSLIGLNV